MLKNSHPSQRGRIAPRGIRNNNPLNIRIGNVWLGERANPDDPEFEQFVSMIYGIRAAFVLLRRYIKHYKRQTIRQIISAWAPANENATDSYIKAVSERINISADTQLSFEDGETMCRLVDAMIRVECGQPVDERQIREGYRLA